MRRYVACSAIRSLEINKTYHFACMYPSNVSGWIFSLAGKWFDRAGAYRSTRICVPFEYPNDLKYCFRILSCLPHTTFWTTGWGVDQLNQFFLFKPNLGIFLTTWQLVFRSNENVAAPIFIQNPMNLPSSSVFHYFRNKSNRIFLQEFYWNLI